MLSVKANLTPKKYRLDCSHQPPHAFDSFEFIARMSACSKGLRQVSRNAYANHCSRGSSPLAPCVVIWLSDRPSIPGRRRNQDGNSALISRGNIGRLTNVAAAFYRNWCLRHLLMDVGRVENLSRETMGAPMIGRLLEFGYILTAVIVTTAWLWLILDFIDWALWY